MITEQQKAAALAEVREHVAGDGSINNQTNTDCGDVFYDEILSAETVSTLLTLLQPTAPVDAPDCPSCRGAGAIYKKEIGAKTNTHKKVGCPDCHGSGEKYMRDSDDIRAAQSPKSCEGCESLDDFRLQEIAVLKSQCEGLVKALEYYTMNGSRGSKAVAISALAEHRKNMGGV